MESHHSVQSKLPIDLKQDEDQHYQATLLAEYEFCQKDGHVLEANIWQSATVFIGLSLGGISFLATQPITGRSDLLLHWSISLAAIAVLSLWRRVLRRWYYIRAVWYYRMTEIEQRLGMWRERYLSYLNQVALGRFQPQEEEEFRFKELYRSVAKQRVSATRQSINRIINILILVWVSLAVYSGVKFTQTESGQNILSAIRSVATVRR